jgi:hypothetical protein
MLRVGDKPVLRLIIDQFGRDGFSHFVLSVNCRAKVSKEYFKEGSDFDVAIDYLQETEQLGATGCLSLSTGPDRGGLRGEWRCRGRLGPARSVASAPSEGGSGVGLPARAPVCYSIRGHLHTCRARAYDRREST